MASKDTVNTSWSSTETPIVPGKRFEWLVQRLHDLRFEVGAQSVILVDKAGRVLVEVGTIEGLEPAVVGMALSNSLAARLEIGPQLHEERALNLIYHEGVRFDIYAANVDDEMFIALMFDRRQGASRIGMVWLYAKRAIQDLQNLDVGSE
jgi:hypothetical protein